MAFNPFDGPIPGENYTADTKNFPWFRPPEYTDFDECIEVIYERLFDDEHSSNFMTWIELGSTITDLTQMIVMSGIMKGMWSVDYGILLAGPVAHMLVIMCRGAQIEFDLGTEKNQVMPTSVYFRALSQTMEELEEDEEGDEESPPSTIEPAPAEQGLGSPLPPEQEGLGAPPSPTAPEVEVQ